MISVWFRVGPFGPVVSRVLVPFVQRQLSHLLFLLVDWVYRHCQDYVRPRTGPLTMAYFRDDFSYLSACLYLTCSPSRYVRKGCHGSMDIKNLLQVPQEVALQGL